MAKFRVRARTVDMLGRQQIAGIPTAISELFKNAHDAYARTVEVDYFRDDGLFVLRDDGLGMTREDFEQRWLTLGTESKVSGAGGLKLPPKDPDQPERPVLGEKGIGRLAIAIIGPQVLVLTRAKRGGRPDKKTIGAYINWRLFELPGLDLEDVIIPVREFRGGDLPDGRAVREMVAEAVAALDAVADRADHEGLNEIRQQMNAFKVDPAECASYLREPSLTADGCGTHFYILPADPIMQADIDYREEDSKATRFEKNLLGFTNTMTPGHKPPSIITRFRDYVDEGAPIERIGERTFFTPEEFKEVDHHFTGRFDEYGQFRGKVGIYQMKPEDYVLSWSETDGRPTECGPFSLSFAYMHGKAIDSLVPPEEYARLAKKLNCHGGLYIYRDGIRVQPYGDSDYDFLDIERRRTLSASHYFYSYRRMFGVIEISGTENNSLTEKAGREGFRENKAYRQFRSILMNFFLQTAGDFFREEGRYAESFLEKKGELNRNEEIRRKKAQQVTVKRRALQESLTRFFDAVEARRVEVEVEKTVTEAKRKADQILRSAQSPTHKATALMAVEQEGRNVFHDLRKELTVIKPRGVGLSQTLTNEWTAYQTESARLEKEFISPAESNVERLVSDAAIQGKIPLDHMARLDAALRGNGAEAVRTVRRLRTDVEGGLTDIGKHVRETTRESFMAVNRTVDDVMAELAKLTRSSSDMTGLSKVRAGLEQRILTVFAEERERLERLRDQLQTVSLFWQKDGYDSAELTEALEEELEELRERRDSSLELAQIGMALNTISHEFEKTIGALRDGFRRMKAWVEANPRLDELYQDMRNSFDHLDGYLTLFTPLDRRLYRKKVRITGKQIRDFLAQLFESQLERHNISLKATKDFLNVSLTGYPSTFYPVFVNLADNSIFWLQRIQGRPREIELNAEGADLLVRDNGPGVSDRDRQNIFLLNFSRKPGGRGMGLYISRESLAKVEYTLTLDPKSHSEGAVFRISPSRGGTGREEVNDGE